MMAHLTYPANFFVHSYYRHTIRHVEDDMDILRQRQSRKV